MARTRIDLLPVTLRELKISAFHRGWVKLGMGVHLRARETPQGFDVRIRYGKDDVIKKSTVATSDIPYGTRGTLRRSLLCAGCNKAAPKYLYLGRDFRFFCARCLGVDPWKVRVPIKWDLGEEIKFRQLLRRKVDQDILSFELAALRSLTPSEFFESRPYLMPEWMAKVKHLDEMLYKKFMKVMHDRYKSAMMKRKVRYLSEKETEWLLDKLQLVMEKSSIITKKEITWLRNHKEQLRSDSYTGQSQKTQDHFPAVAQSGSQPSSKWVASSLPPSVTDCLSKRMSSAAAMSVALAKVLGDESVPSAAAREATPDAAPSSSAPTATEKDQ